MGPQPSDNSNHLLQATRYLMAELTPVEMELFESQLESDLELCDALSEAVFLQQSLSGAEVSIQVQSAHLISPKTRQRSRIGMLIALLLFVSVGIILFRTNAESTGDSKLQLSFNSSQDAVEVAELWSLMGEEEKADSIVEEDRFDLEPGLAVYDVPDWMIVAVQVGDSPGVDIMSDVDDGETL